MLLLRLSSIALPLLYFQPKFLFRNTSRMITTINFTHVGDKEGCMHPLHMFQYEFSQTANADTKDSYLVLISWSKTCVKLLILYLLMCVYLQKLQVIPPPLFTSIYLLQGKHAFILIRYLKGNPHVFKSSDKCMP